MTAQTQSIKRKLSLLQLAEELGSVARASKIMSFHRDTFYEVCISAIVDARFRLIVDGVSA